MHLTVNQAAYAFEGSNPSLSILIIRTPKRWRPFPYISSLFSPSKTSWLTLWLTVVIVISGLLPSLHRQYPAWNLSLNPGKIPWSNAVKPHQTLSFQLLQLYQGAKKRFSSIFICLLGLLIIPSTRRRFQTNTCSTLNPNQFQKTSTNWILWT